MTRFSKPNQMKRSPWGFTLLELMVVVLIIGIIAAIVVPRVSNSTTKAEEKVQAHHISHLNHMVEIYQIENGQWPADLTDLAPTYLPDGVPTPPQGGSYTINATTHRVEHSP